MSHRTQLTPYKPVENLFRLRPLVACMRVIIAGGLFAGPVAQVYADLPVPAGYANLPVPQATWVDSGSANLSSDGTNMQINQHSDKVTLNWQSFNVGKDNAVQFVQPNASSVALNRIYDSNPSQILGHITANGQIYLVNQNGFVFGNGSVVDTNTLVASALNISAESLNTGIASEFNIHQKAALGTPGQQLGSDKAITVEAGAKIHAGQNGSIILAAPTVENSGSISADQGGQILLVASKDTVYLQPASSSSPFAGLLVEVGTGGKVNNNAGGDVSVRQGNVTLAGFAVNQSGRLSATTSVNVNGSIRLLAGEVGVPGTYDLTTAQTQTVRNPGAVNEEDSTVTFGQNSSVTVLADADGGSAIDSQAQEQSYVEAHAAKIDMQSGSSIVATSGQVNLTATTNSDPLDPLYLKNPNVTGFRGRIDLESGSRIDVSGTKNVQVAMARNVANVSVQSFNLRDAPYQRGGVLQGQTVQVDIRNLPTIVDASSALASIKRGIDERLGTGGIINLVTAGDTVVNSGAVIDISGGSVSYQSGYINTTQLLTSTGRIVDIGKADPNLQYTSIFGVVTELHQKWGVTTTWNILDQIGAGRFEQGYTEGKAGGALNIASPLTLWDGQLIAGSVSGINQRSQPVSGGSLTFNKDDIFDQAHAFLSSQNVSFQTGQQLVNIGIDGKFPKKPNSQQYSDLVLSTALVNQSGISNLTVKTASNPGNPTGGNVTVAKDAALSMPVLSNFNIEASNIDMQGSLYTAGGAITLKSIDTGTVDLSGQLNSGQLNVAASSVLDVSGRWVNDFKSGITSALNTPVVINAGTVSLNADHALNFDKGAFIKADGGAWLGLTGRKLTDGKAGSIGFVAGTSLFEGSLHADGGLSAYGLSQGGSLTLSSAKIDVVDPIKSFVDPINSFKVLINNLTDNQIAQINTSLNETGVVNHKLSKEELINYINAFWKKKEELIGTFAKNNDTNQFNQLVQSAVNDVYKIIDPSALALAVVNGHFAIDPKSGFSTVNLVSNQQNITVKANTDLTLITQNRVLATNYRDQASSSSIAGFSQVTTLPENLRKPVTLSLTGQAGSLDPAASLTEQAAVSLETGSQIHVDKASTVNLTSENIGKGMYINGLIDAPAGNINLTLDVMAGDPGRHYDGSQAIWLGSHANLNTQGTALFKPVDGLGRIGGSVLNGGNVTIKADRGYVVVEQGSKIDVSGTSASLDLPMSKSAGPGLRYSSQVIGSDAGKISITAAEGIALDGTLNAKTGSATNRGGSLYLTLDRKQRSEPQNAVFPVNSLQFNVVQDAQVSLPAKAQFGSNLDSMNGQATVSSKQITQAGVDQLHLTVPLQMDPIISLPRPLQGVIQFMGDVNLNTASSMVFDTQTIGWSGLKNGPLTGAVNLNTAYLQLGSSTFNSNTLNNINLTSALGGGKLTTNAMWTQLEGASLMTGFNEINLNSVHDLRVVGVQALPTDRTFTGILSTAANLNLNASQIYPTTLSNYSIAVTNPAGQLTISGSNTDTTPLSAGGTLTLNAPVINQNGVLKAPLGTIELNAATSLSFGSGSFTSVSADNKTIPFGIIANNVWEYPLGGNSNLVFNQLPDNLPIGQKQMVFTSPDIQFKKGSVVDVSGGGDLQAVQFQPGSGGSYDYLQPGSLSYNKGAFAIMPALGSSLAPFDSSLTTGIAYNAQATVYLNGTGNLPAGEYTVLPTRYALLPGAYLVTPQANTQDQQITTYTTAGLPVVSGYNMLAGTSTQDSRTGGFLIETSAQVQKHSAYDIQSANGFFAQQAATNQTAVPLLPVDSGQISIDASTRLVLDGQFKVAAPNGRGSRMDISAKNQNIEVVTSLASIPTPGTLQLLDQNLSQLHVDSLFLGGNRQFDNVTGNTNLNVTADKVTFDSKVQVQTLDLVAAAKSKVEVMSGATITSSGTVNTGDSIFNLTGDSALLRVSADKQVTVNHLSSGTTGSLLLIDQGAVLSASKSMLLDAGSTVLNGDIVMHGGSLSLSANAINIGDVPSGLAGNALNLTSQQLTKLSVDELALNSRDNVGFYGNVGQLDSSGSLVPLKFNSLVVHAAGLSGFGGSGQSARLEANNLVLANPLNAVSTTTGTGLGSLDLLAANFTQGAGNFAFNGFSKVNLTVNNGFVADGKSVLTVAGDLNLNAGYLTTTGGSSFTLDDSGHALQINGNGSSFSPVASVFGGAMEFIADTVGFNANALLASGALSLHALSGDVTVSSAANIDLAGRARAFADTLDYTPGGKFTAIADNGAVALAAGSQLDLSTGGGSAAGGKLVLNAPKQNVTLDGQIKATGGSALFDVSTFSAASSFDSLMAVLKTAGIADSIYFRSRDASIIDAASTAINANNITLVADKGAVDILGQLNANGAAQGGNINVYAGDKITLEASSQLTATGAKGGKVMLSSVDSNSGIELKGGSLVDVSGSSAGNGGDVTLRVLRTGNGINIQPIAGTVTGASNFYAEGVKKYANADFGTLGQINANDIAMINADTAAYMTTANMANVAGLGNGIRLRPGVEIDYKGDLTNPDLSLANAWDFSTQRFGTNLDIPGTLLITSTGKLNMDNSLTDGFNGNQLQNGNSWSFQLVSGADQTSADKLATVDLTSAEILANSTAKDLTIGTGVSIHTGTGDIKLASGGNVVLTDQTSTVYNAGRQDINPYGSLANHRHPAGEYPIAGGDLVIRAGGNITGAVSNQFLASWLTSQGNHKNSRATLSTLTAWAVDASQFQQNIGSFGGGIVDIAAAGNINDLSVMMPTTGKQLGNDFVNYANNALQIQGGGQMRVNAGGDISGGAYFLGKGDGIITAGGEIKGSSSTDPNAFIAGPQLVMSGNQSDPVGGNSNLTLNAGTGVKIAAVSDAMVLNNLNSSTPKPKFFSYTDKSILALKSLSGDIHLNSDTSVVTNILGITNPLEQQLTTVYPASLDVTAFGGSVKLDSSIILFPSAVSNMNVLAKQDISSGTCAAGAGQCSIIMSDANPALLPNANSTINVNTDPVLIDAAYIFNYTQTIDGSGFIGGGSTYSNSHAQSPIHTGDKVPARLVTQTGDISSVNIILPKQSIIQAGRDLINNPMQIQQINQADSSIIAAGRDLIFTQVLDRNGAPTPGSKLNQIVINGPGNTLVKTGRNLNLGASGGLITVGNLFNPNLPSSGASLDVLVGLNAGTPNYSAFIDKYLLKNPLYVDQLGKVETLITPFMRQRSGNALLSDADALKAFGALAGDQTLPVQPQLNAILTGVFFNELKIAGSASAADKAVGNKGGFAAIDTLFPGNQWQGDLTLFFSTLQTIAGGDINLMVPGGQVNAGLSVAPDSVKTADQLGITVQGQGQINAFVKNDFLVNTSRVFTLGGGDVLIWSSEGNIDAGKGAKSALSVKLIKPQFNPVTNSYTSPKVTITNGSGIRAASSGDVAPGNVFLFAPQGVVNAGEAGIGGTNVTISATAVLGANNIQVGGVSTGVPVASTGSLAAGLTGTSNLGANVSQVAQAVTGVNDSGSTANKNAALGMFSVEVLGFGD